MYSFIAPKVRSKFKLCQMLFSKSHFAKPGVGGVLVEPEETSYSSIDTYKVGYYTVYYNNKIINTYT